MKDLAPSNRNHEIYSPALSENEQEAWEFRGAFQTTASLRNVIDAAMMRGIIEVKEKKFWRIWKFESFAHWLNSDEVPDFASTKFYNIKKRFDFEGDVLFNLYQRHKVPLSTRLLLAENNVKVEIDEGKNEFVVQGERVSMDDNQAVKEVCQAVRNALVIRDHREDELKKSHEKLKKSNEAKDRTIASFKHKSAVDLLAVNEEYLTAYMDLGTAYKKLIKQTEALAPDDKRNWREIVFTGISNYNQTLSDAFALRGSGLTLAAPTPPATGDEKGDFIARGIHETLRDAILPEDEGAARECFSKQLDTITIDDNEAELAAKL